MYNGGVRFGGLVAISLGCTQLIGAEEREAIVRPPPAIDCSKGPQLRTCGGAEVDVCAATGHCGACGSVCEGDLRRCVTGICHDHAWPAWKPGDGVGCAPLGADPRILVDSSTGLWWEAAEQSSVTTYAEAVGHCDGLNAESFGGHSDWTLPTRIELMSTLDYSRPDPLNNKCGWSLPRTSYVCTRSLKADDNTEHWLYNIAEGSFSTLPIGDPAVMSANVRCRPRCVRATKFAPTERFVDVSDGVYDRVTDLTWEKTIANGKSGDIKPGFPTDFTRIGGLRYCENRPSAGNRWALPTLKQLATIVDERRIAPPIDPLFITVDAKQPFYWSDTPNLVREIPFPHSYYWVVWFDYGQITGATTGQSADIPETYAYVRCVHLGNVDAKK